MLGNKVDLPNALTERDLAHQENVSSRGTRSCLLNLILRVGGWGGDTWFTARVGEKRKRGVFCRGACMAILIQLVCVFVH